MAGRPACLPGMPSQSELTCFADTLSAVRRKSRTMKVSNHSPEIARASTFSFGLRSLFVFVAACATVLALYSQIGTVVVGLLFVAAVVVWAVTWIIDSYMAIREMFFPFSRTRSFGGIEEEIKSVGRVQAQQTLVEQLRNSEQIAQDRFNACAGPLEDVLRTRGVRLKAEIDLLRQSAASSERCR